MDISVKRLALALGLTAALIAAGGCNKQQTDKDAIRAGIMLHLSSVGGLNLGAMDMEIHSVTINGNQAHAEVERPGHFSPAEDEPKPVTATILLSHTHWDHIQGFPFFAPLFVPGNRFLVCGPQGAGMQVAYNLEKRDGAWVVQKTQPMGGAMQHPDPNQKPGQNQDVHSGSLPNFNDVLNTGGARAQSAAPPPQQASSQPGGQDSTSYKKPR